MFCESKGQELNSFSCKKEILIFWHTVPGTPRGAFKDLKNCVWSGCVQIWWANLIWRISAKRRKQKGHFKCIKKHKITPRSCYLSAIMVLSSFFMLTTTNVFHCDKCKCEAKEIPMFFPQRQLLHKSLKLTDARFKWIRKHSDLWVFNNH